METVLENHRKTWDEYHKRGYHGYTKDPDGRAKIIEEFALKKINDKSIILEIGCGSGEIMKCFAPKVSRVWGVDISKSAVEIATRNLLEFENAAATVNDGYTLKLFDSKMFDFIYSFWTFQHIPRNAVVNYIREAKRVLKDDGLLVFQVVSYNDEKLNGGDIGLLNGETTQVGYTLKMVQKVVLKGEMRLHRIKTEKWLPDRVFFWVVCGK